MGQLLQDTERADGGDAQRTRLLGVTESPLTLTELGITKRESSDAQLLATLDEEVFEAVKSGKQKIARIRREKQREQQIAEIRT